MVTVREVQTKKEQREFLNFPLRLYRDNPNFVPPLYGDEKKIFRRDYVYYDTCEAVYYNAYRDGKIVGRISGILQKAANEKNHEKRVRFTRFDSIDDQEVAVRLALTGAVRDDILDKEALAARLMSLLHARYPQALAERCKIAPDAEGDGFALLELVVELHYLLEYHISHKMHIHHLLQHRN